jgi:hypothetical protein
LVALAISSLASMISSGELSAAAGKHTGQSKKIMMHNAAFFILHSLAPGPGWRTNWKAVTFFRLWGLFFMDLNMTKWLTNSP